MKGSSSESTAMDVHEESHGSSHYDSIMDIMRSNSKTPSDTDSKGDALIGNVHSYDYADELTLQPKQGIEIVYGKSENQDTIEEAKGTIV